MTDDEKILELIILDAAGIISPEDSAELLKFMNYRKDFPWNQLGDYQNLAALLAITVDQKPPSVYIKENVLKIVKKSRERKMMAYDKSGNQFHSRESIETIQEKRKPGNNFQSESISLKEPELYHPDNLNQPQEFEEVKSRVALIKEKQGEKTFSEKPSKLREFRAADFFKDKSGKNKKPRSRNFMLIASILLIAVVGIGFIFIVSSSDDKQVQAEPVESHNEMLISEAASGIEEPIPEPFVESVGFVVPDSLIVEESESIEEENLEPMEEEIPETRISDEVIKDENIIPVEKIEMPVVEPTAMIEIPLSEPPKEVKDKKVIQTNLTLTKNQVNLVDETIYLVAVEEMPAPIGGISAIHEKITYPELARRNGVEGKVYVLAYVDDFGSVTKATITKGIGMGCDEAATDAVLNTKFKPGLQGGKPVKVQITIPITFKHK